MRTAAGQGWRGRQHARRDHEHGQGAGVAAAPHDPVPAAEQRGVGQLAVAARRAGGRPAFPEDGEGEGGRAGGEGGLCMLVWFCVVQSLPCLCVCLCVCWGRGVRWGVDGVARAPTLLTPLTLTPPFRHPPVPPPFGPPSRPLLQVIVASKFDNRLKEFGEKWEVDKYLSATGYLPPNVRPFFVALPKVRAACGVGEWGGRGLQQSTYDRRAVPGTCVHPCGTALNPRPADTLTHMHARTRSHPSSRPQGPFAHTPHHHPPSCTDAGATCALAPRPPPFPVRPPA